MPEQLQHKTVFSLAEVSRGLQRYLSEKFNGLYWIRAEMNKLNYYPHSGHCYPELLEKQDGKTVAQMRATLWKYDFYRINNQFKALLHEPLKDGIKILFQARITYDAVYGLALNIVDMDPTFTLGDLEREKTETILRLQTEGLFQRNKQLPLPLLPKRIAIISVESSKGYADFMQVLNTNPYGYHFIHRLFPALLQGDKAVDSIIDALSHIQKQQQRFDIVAIIRGGGAEVGLSCFNDYRLSKAVAQFPLPVFSGIGHATNETVTELVSHTNGITPTKIAERLIEHFHQFSRPLQAAEELLINISREMLESENETLQHWMRLFRSSVNAQLSHQRASWKDSSRSLMFHSRALLQEQKLQLPQFQKALHRGSQRRLLSEWKQQTEMQLRLPLLGERLIKQQSDQLLWMDKRLQLLRPEEVLKRGYSISFLNGRLLRSATELKPGDEIETQFADGRRKSVVSEDGTTELNSQSTNSQ